MASIEFRWSHDGRREDGSVVSGLHYRLYENGQLAVDDIAELHFSLLMEGKAFGKYAYHVTAVDMMGLESPPSNTKDIDFFRPSAPTGLTASFSG